jgi:outer membrane lipoprotein-sorting protein
VRQDFPSKELLTIGLLWLVFLESFATAQNPASAGSNVLLSTILAKSFATAQNQEPITLDSVLKKMDATAANFQSAQADFVFDQYQKVVDEHDISKGTVYYRRSGQQIEMMADFREPDRKFVLYKDGKLQIYQPKIDRLMEYSAGADHREIESFLVLGFGGSGQDLKKSFDVSYKGQETVDGTATAMLELTPKSEKVRGNFPQIILWIDMNRGISVQQKLVQTQGDSRLANYSDIKVPAKINNDVFRLKTTGKTKVVTPGG